MSIPLVRLLALSLLLSLSARANLKPFEIWARFGYPTDMATEWLVVEDYGDGTPRDPTAFVIHSLVQPRVTKVDRHWEITFDPATRKKPLLAAHFDNSQANDPKAGGYQAKPQTQREWFYRSTTPPPAIWLTVRSREYWDGQFTPLNIDPDHTGQPTQYTLDPANAEAISFFEPVVTAQNDEWTITFPSLGNLDQKHLAANESDWFKHHPGPKLPTAPAIRYSPTMQKQFEAWQKALKDWQKAGAHGLSPRLEDFFHFTPEQAKQYQAWEKARSLWYATGQGPFPQPIDFVKETPGAP